jgi:hypothetical protein
MTMFFFITAAGAAAVVVVLVAHFELFFKWSVSCSSHYTGTSTAVTTNT